MCLEVYNKAKQKYSTLTMLKVSNVKRIPFLQLSLNRTMVHCNAVIGVYLIFTAAQIFHVLQKVQYITN